MNMCQHNEAFLTSQTASQPHRLYMHSFPRDSNKDGRQTNMQHPSSKFLTFLAFFLYMLSPYETASCRTWQGKPPIDQQPQQNSKAGYNNSSGS